MTEKLLTALPVYNEAAHVAGVLEQVRRYSRDVLVVDDGSSDGTAEILQRLRWGGTSTSPQIPAGEEPPLTPPEYRGGGNAPEYKGGTSTLHVIRHPTNRGYGAALKSAFDFALQQGFDVLVTIDCDGQHQPARIPDFFRACVERDVDIVSGSRYLQQFSGDSAPPPDRFRINRQITDQVNQLLGLNLTDAFCGFKAYRVPALAKLTITEPGYGMPLEFWVEAVSAGLVIEELPVPLIYLDEKRSFGGSLDDAQRRMAYYQEVIQRALARKGFRRPDGAVTGERRG